MAKLTLSLNELRKKAGEHLGVSDWHEITQEQINLFADATGDHQWIHVDPELAKQGPFGGTIAHGYLTLSLAPMLLWEVLHVPDAPLAVNYGINRLRFPAPVPVGGRVRASIDLGGAEEVRGGVQATFVVTFELEGSEKPACVAELLFRYVG
ncbi:MAG: MaoC family dehydratase [Egibacteraceae bacterium]